MQGETLMRVSDLAKRLNVCARTVYRMVDSGRGPRAVRVGKRLRWTHESVAAWLAKGGTK